MRLQNIFTVAFLFQMWADGSFQNLHIFINRYHTNRSANLILTMESLQDTFFTTKVSINDRRLVDFFQTNTSEMREPVLWYRTESLEQTLDFYGVFADKKLPYRKCFYHVSRVMFFLSGYHYISTTVTSNGLSADENKSFGSTYIDLEENIRCQPQFDIPRCHNASRPLHYVTSEVIVLRAVFSKRCPLDSFTQYSWTLHDSTENRKKIHTLVCFTFLTFL